MKKVKSVGVVGAGKMGAALAQKFAQEGFEVLLADREERFVDNGINGIKETLAEGVERRIFTPEKVQATLEKITATVGLDELKNCDLIVEAIYEDFDAKSRLFEQLSEIAAPDAILATNTSSFSVTELSKAVKNPERFIGVHYFYHAAKNRLVEIIPGAQTSDDTYKAMKNFALLTGKDAITTTDVYGFAVNRFFVPWLNEAVRILEEGIAPITVIDKVCMKTFGIGMGPFALMNATGIPVAFHAEKTLEAFGNFYKVAEGLEKQTKIGELWEIGNIESAEPTKEQVQQIRDRMLGATFFVCAQILDKNVCSASDLNRGARIGLRWRKGPIGMMQQIGEQEVGRLVQMISDRFSDPMPNSIKSPDWQMEFVILESSGNRAVITMSRPEDLNALNEEEVWQLGQRFNEAESAPEVETIFITGKGKAFVGGADIGFFVKNMKSNRIDNIVDFTRRGQEIFDRIETSNKKVVAILNGMALGGGLELALCADTILATPNALIAFPETGIGIYPGLGGTQRTAKRIGKGLSKFLILTGKMLNAKKAKEIGLIDEVISLEVVSSILDGSMAVPSAADPNTTNVYWQGIASLFEKNGLDDLLSGGYTNVGLDSEEVAKMVKTMKFKAPIAMYTAEKLIDEAKGCSAELDELEKIFSTSDAMLGLSSIGKRVTFEGK